MKNINKIIISLSLLAMVPVVAQNDAEKTATLKQAAKNAGQKADSMIMGVPYYFGSALGYVGSGIKNTVFYGVKVPFRLAGWGLDGTFGDGMSNAVYNKTKTGLGLGLTAALLGGVYKGLNGFAKWIAISDIQKAFENGGEVTQLGNKIPLKYGLKTYTSLDKFYTGLATELKKRFEYTDFQAYIQKPLEKRMSITLVCDEIETLIDDAMNGDVECDIESICAIARKSVTNGLFGRFNILNGYCQDALVLYCKIILAKKLSKGVLPLEQNDQLKIEDVLKHKDILEKLNARISKKIVKN